ncbi:MAG TPA: methyltransferase domain-containing protein [Pseudonocardiaceae bacterium]|nr:methyltransferase domain-containing protein [Pseudonocardiaceae bacterium]
MWTAPGERAPASTLSDLANRAQERQTEYLIETLGLAANTHMLDIGSGTGLPAIRFAQHSGGRVTSITPSHTQVDKATELAHSMGFADRVTFRLGNAMALEFADESFDAALAIDIFAHLSDRQLGFHEAARVLRPGGQFLMSEFTIRGTPDAEELAAYTQTWCCMPPVSPARTMELAANSGFELVKVDSMVQNCSFSGELMGLLYADRHDEIVERYGAELVADMDKVVPLVRSFIHDHLGSYLFLLRKL